jgi:hypothetical protein
MTTLRRHSLVATGPSLALVLVLVAATAIASGVASPRLARANPGGWGLVLGADPNPQGAAAEVARARRTLGVRATIYRCGNWFRTVAVVPQKEQALDLLSRAQTQSPYNPYLVEMASWCPGKSLVP